MNPGNGSTMFHKPFLFAVILFSAAHFIISGESLAQTGETYGLAVLPLQGMGISEMEAATLTEIFHSGISQILTNPNIKL